VRGNRRQILLGCGYSGCPFWRPFNRANYTRFQSKDRCGYII